MCGGVSQVGGRRHHASTGPYTRQRHFSFGKRVLTSRVSGSPSRWFPIGIPQLLAQQVRLLWTGLGPQTFLPSPDSLSLSLALSSSLSSASLPTELSQGAFGSQGRHGDRAVDGAGPSVKPGITYEDAMALELSELPLHYSSISIILKRSLRAGARLPLPRSRAGPASSAVACLAPMRPAGSGAGAGGCNPADPVASAGGCVEADHVQRLVLLARADSSTKA